LPIKLEGSSFKQKIDSQALPPCARRQERRELAPRLFCDICDIFDAHDTEDCPTQSMLEAEAAGHGADHKYERGESRPYCEDCEGTD